MAKNSSSDPGAGSTIEQPIAGTSQMAGATMSKESLLALPKDKLVEYIELQQLAGDTLKRRISILQGQLSKQQSVSLKWGAKERDIANVEVKTYGMTGLQAANETISTMVSSLFTLQKLGFLSGVDGVADLPKKLKGLDLSELQMTKEDI